MMAHKQFGMRGLPERPEKPRNEGMTLMLDKGLSCRQVEDVLEVAADYVDLVKLGWGTALVTPALERKLALYREAGLAVYLGGTLFEAFYLRNQCDVYRRLLQEMQISHVEISDGSLQIGHKEKLDCIRRFAKDFTVLSEVGSKDADYVMPPDRWVQLIQDELDAGSWKVICESRESGTAGLYKSSGEVRTCVVDKIASLIDQHFLIFEAPQKVQQVWFIRHFGANVNLGNISPEELVPLETLRLGLRSDTLFEFCRPVDNLFGVRGPSLVPDNGHGGV